MVSGTRDMKLMQIASKWYSDKKLAHCIRVALYAANDPLITDKDVQESLWTIGLLHDILEGTGCTMEEVRQVLTYSEYNALKEITHNKEERTYEEHLNDILETNNPIVMTVKRADIKDHLMQKDALTNKQKEKYLPTIKYLL